MPAYLSLYIPISISIYTYLSILARVLLCNSGWAGWELTVHSNRLALNLQRSACLCPLSVGKKYTYTITPSLGAYKFPSFEKSLEKHGLWAKPLKIFESEALFQNSQPKENKPQLRQNSNKKVNFSCWGKSNASEIEDNRFNFLGIK